MTEDEAKKLWCPFTQPDARTQECIGSACMAWKSVRPKIFVTYKDEPEKEWGWDPTGHENYKEDVKRVRYEKQGICKLINK